MSKKIRPSLKDYLRTGEVHMEPVEASEPSPSAPEAVQLKKKNVKATPARPREKKQTAPAKRTVRVKEPLVAQIAEKTPLSTPEGIFLELLSEADRKTWEPILQAGTEINSFPLDFVAIREDFRTMDRSRFTFYILDEKGADLRPVRTSVQIREPIACLAKWDEMGILTLYELKDSKN